MKILFIDPMGDRESTGLNIGIAYCASSVMKNGHTVSVMDLVNIRKPDPLLRIRTAIEAFRPGCVGISVTNMSFKNSKAYADDIKKYFDGRVILGGPEISALGSRALELIPSSDMAVVGEGEAALVELFDAMEKKSALGAIKGLVWRDGEKVVTNIHREFMNNLDGIDFPNYDVFGVDKMDVYPIVTTRGCPYGCAFCFSHLGKKWRSRSAENMIEELKAAKYKYGAKLFHISDASFNVDIGRVEKFCRLLMAEKLDMPWVIQGFRADRMTEDMMRRLSEANCKRIWVGVETMDEGVFNGINKGESLETIKRGIALMKKYNIEIFGYMLMGLPGDTLDKTLRSFEKARELDLDLLAYASCVPFTGTRIEDWTKKNARILRNLYEISSIGTQYNNIAFETDDFTENERIKARKILNIKSGSYNEPDTNLALFKIKKWLLIFRYDFKNVFKRLKQSIMYRLKYKTSVDSINLHRGIYFSRLPDGTWGLAEGEKVSSASQKRLYLDLKRLTISEVEVTCEKC